MTETATPAHDPDLALIAEACKKSGLMWVALDGGTARPVWHVWSEGPAGAAAYVVSGDGEQPLPGVEQASSAVVTVRSKDNGGRLVTWRAELARVEPGSAEWDAVVPSLVGNRLNATDGERAAERWATNARITRLRPSGDVLEKPGAMPDSAHAAPAAPTPARTRTPLPWVFGGQKRMRRRGRR